MTFSELTRLMLHSMDFFELRRTAARYEVPFQGVRRNKLVRELEKKIILKNAQLNDSDKEQTINTVATSTAEKIANYRKRIKPLLSTKINTFSSLESNSRVYDGKQN